jgi:hypothetical protein
MRHSVCLLLLFLPLSCLQIGVPVVSDRAETLATTAHLARESNQPAGIYVALPVVIRCGNEPNGGAFSKRSKRRVGDRRPAAARAEIERVGAKAL